jgi:hypothetical protein
MEVYKQFGKGIKLSKDVTGDLESYVDKANPIWYNLNYFGGGRKKHE